MSERKITVHLHGVLGRRFGKKRVLSVSTPGECLRALINTVDGFEELIRKGEWCMRRGTMNLHAEELTMPVSRARTVHIHPAPRVGGIEWIILGGIALVAAAVVVTTALVPKLEAPDADDLEIARNTSAIVDGTPNNTKSGHPFSVTYGEVISGTDVGSVAVTTTEAATGSGSTTWTGGYGDGFGGGFSGWAGTALNLHGGGGKGGGSSRTAREDPNTLTSNARVKVLDILGEGDIVGPAKDGLKWIIYDGTPVENDDGSMNYDGVWVDWRAGLPDQDPVVGFDTIESTHEVGIEATSTESPVYTITGADIDRARVTLRLGSLYKQDIENGDLLKTRVTMAIDLQSDGNGYTQVGSNKVFAGKTLDTYDRSYELELPSGQAPHNIRVRRVTADTSEASIQDDTFFALVGEIIDAKLTYPYTAYVAQDVDIKQFGTNIPTRGFHIKGRVVEVPTNYDPVARTYTGDWDGTFKLAYTNNPAWCLRDLCLHERYGLGDRIKAPFLDKWPLYKISKQCDVMVPDGNGGTEPRHQLNIILRRQQDAYDVLQQFAELFDGMIFWGAGFVTFSQNVDGLPKRLVSQANTIKDSLDFQSSSLRDMHSVFSVSYNDINDNWKLHYETLEDKALKRKIGSKLKKVPGWGFSSAGQARRYAAKLFEQQKLGTATYTAGADHEDVFPGDLVEISDRRITGGVRMAGRLKKGSTTTTIKLDHPVVLLSGQSYQLKTYIDGDVAIRDITSPAGEHTELTVEAFDSAPSGFMLWHLISDVVPASLFRVITKEDTSKSGQYKITCVDFDVNRVTNIDNVSTPTRVSPVNELPRGPVATPGNISIREHWENNGTMVAPVATMSWVGADDSRVVSYEAQVLRPDVGAWENVFSGVERSCVIPFATVGTYRFRVKARTNDDRASVWRDSGDVELTNAEADLPLVTNLTATADNDAMTARLSWTKPVDVRPFEYEILFDANGNELTAESLGKVSTNEFTINRRGTYYVRTVFLGVSSLSVEQVVDNDDLPEVAYLDVVGAPQNLSDLDAVAAASISANAQGVANLVTTYGSTAAAAQSAANALVAQSTSELAASNAAAALSLTENARDLAQSYQNSASASASVSVSSAIKTLPSQASSGGNYFSHGARIAAPDSLPDIDDHSAVSVGADSDGSYFQVNAANFYACQKGHLPFIVGNTYQIRLLVKKDSGDTGTTYASLRFLAGDYLTSYNAEFPISKTLTSGVEELIGEYTATQAKYDEGARYIRGESLLNWNNTTGVNKVYLLSLKDITSEKNSALSASAAATNAQNAGASETASAQSAAASQAARTGAETARAGSEVAQASAATSETNSAASAASAASSATIAVNAQSAAGTSANAAANSATTAQAHADAAGVSATTSQASSISAVAARDASINATIEGLPSSLSAGAEYFSHGAFSSSPNSAADIDAHVNAAMGFDSDGAYVEINGSNFYGHQKGHLPYVVGNTYRAILLIKKVSGDTGSTYASLRYVAGDYSTHYGAIFTSSITLSSGVEKIVVEHTATQAKYDEGSRYIRAEFLLNWNNTTGVNKVYAIGIADITSEKSSLSAASASAASAASAAASETAAGQSASSALSSQNSANTSAASASASEGQAAISETNAAGSASAAAASSVVAANAATDAINNSVQGYPTNFSKIDNWSGTTQPTIPFSDKAGLGSFTQNGSGILQATSHLTYVNVYSKFAEKLVPGNTYRIKLRARVHTDATNGSSARAGIQSSYYRADGTFESGLGSLSSGIKTASDGWFFHEYEFVALDYDLFYVRLYFNFDSGGHSDARWELSNCTLTDITSEKSSGTSATASAASAASAAASETAAGGFSTAAQNHSVNAATSAASASVSQSSAAASAATATSAASAAQSYMQVAASLTSDSYLLNPTFSVWDDGQSMPRGWGNYQSPGTYTRETSSARFENGLRYVLSSSDGDRGAVCYSYYPYNNYHGLLQSGAYQNRYWVMESWVYLVSGNWTGAGLWMNLRVPGGASSAGKTVLMGLADQNLPTGQWVKASKFVDLGDMSSVNAGDAAFYILNNYNTFGGAAAKDIIWGSASARPATEQEIATGAVQDISGAVTSLSSVIAELQGRVTAHWGVETGVSEVTGTFISARTTLTNGTIDSNVSIGAREFAVYNRSDSTWKKAMSVSGGDATFYGNLNALGAMTFGTRKIPLALQSFPISGLADGDVIDFGGDLTKIPGFTIDTTTLAPLAAGQQYDVALTNLSSTGATLRAKVTTPGTNTTTTSSGSTAGVGVEPDVVLHKSSATDATNGDYKFIINGTIRIFGAIPAQGFPEPEPGEPGFGSLQIELFVRPSGGSWTSIGTTTAYDSSSSNGTKSFTHTATRNYANVIGQDSDQEFGISAVNPGSGEAVSSFTVQWTNTSQSGTASATPNGETCSVTILPQNA